MRAGVVQEGPVRGLGNRAGAFDQVTAFRHVERIGKDAETEALAGKQQGVDARLIVGDEIGQMVDGVGALGRVVEIEGIRLGAASERVAANSSRQEVVATSSRLAIACYLSTLRVTCVSPEKPSARAAAGETSMIRPRTKGPRSLMVTTTERPLFLFVTRTLVPNDSDRWAAVRASGFNC